MGEVRSDGERSGIGVGGGTEIGWEEEGEGANYMLPTSPPIERQ